MASRVVCEHTFGYHGGLDGDTMLSKPSILFVDDERNILDGLSRSLATEAARWEMIFCDSPDEALYLYKSRQFDIIVVDMMMPRINGIELVLEMKQISQHSSYIMLTGTSDMGVAVEAINRAEIFRFFTKPCPKLLLVEGIAAALDARARSPHYLENSPSMAALDSIVVGVLIVDPKARVLFMNSLGGQLCAADDGICVGSDQIIRLSKPASTAKFHTLISQAANGAGDGLFMIERPELGSPLSAFVALVPTCGPTDVQIGIYLRDPLSKKIPSPEQLAPLFSLTRGEARIAHSLVLGYSLEEAATMSGIATGTARNYLKRVFNKLDVTRQSEIVRKILSYF